MMYAVKLKKMTIGYVEPFHKDAQRYEPKCQFCSTQFAMVSSYDFAAAVVDSHFLRHHLVREN